MGLQTVYSYVSFYNFSHSSFIVQKSAMVVTKKLYNCWWEQRCFYEVFARNFTVRLVNVEKTCGDRGVLFTSQGRSSTHQHPGLQSVHTAIPTAPPSQGSWTPFSQYSHNNSKRCQKQPTQSISDSVKVRGKAPFTHAWSLWGDPFGHPVLGEYSTVHSVFECLAWIICCRWSLQFNLSIIW